MTELSSRIVELSSRQAERIAAHDWSVVRELGREILVTGDIVNAHYSKWVYTVWHEMPFEIRRRVVLTYLDERPSDAALADVAGDFRRWYTDNGMCERAAQVYCLDISLL